MEIIARILYCYIITNVFTVPVFKADKHLSLMVTGNNKMLLVLSVHIQ